MVSSSDSGESGTSPPVPLRMNWPDSGTPQPETVPRWCQADLEAVGTSFGGSGPVFGVGSPKPVSQDLMRDGELFELVNGSRVLAVGRIVGRAGTCH
jgi:hypothetical protein